MSWEQKTQFKIVIALITYQNTYRDNERKQYKNNTKETIKACQAITEEPCVEVYMSLGPTTWCTVILMPL